MFNMTCIIKSIRLPIASTVHLKRDKLENHFNHHFTIRWLSNADKRERVKRKETEMRNIIMRHKTREGRGVKKKENI